ncbi:MAG: DUF4271 domain-containing protein [Mucilaginibacter sp.]|uniref:DUF4271 domain-containing protein n=1 Tax=Mucilaginibacter sp. TaxID=1882438 RepID=UPI003265D5DE
MRSIILVLFTVLVTSLSAHAQQDTILKAYRDTTFVTSTDTLAKPVLDTIPALIKMPDSLRHNQFIDTLLKRFAFDPYLFNSHSLLQQKLRMGHERPSRDTWVVFAILVLLIYTGTLNRILSKDIYNVVLGFYLKSSFAKLSKEDNLLTSWAFIFLFLLFGFTMGMYIYQIIKYYNAAYSISGFQLFMACSVLVIVLFVLKIMVLRVLGFIFNIHKLIREYISILYLTYFNLAFIFLPVIICFSLLPSVITPYLLKVSIAIIAIVMLIQYTRSILNIISNFTFHKIYLFIYLCALEICPVLIIIKALNL